MADFKSAEASAGGMALAARENKPRSQPGLGHRRPPRFPHPVCSPRADTHTRKTSTDGHASASALFSRVRRVSARLLPPQRAEHGPTAPRTPAAPQLGENPALPRSEPSRPRRRQAGGAGLSRCSPGEPLAAQTPSGCTTPGHKPQAEQAIPPPRVTVTEGKRTPSNFGQTQL